VGQHYGDATVPLDVQADLRDGTRFPPFRVVEALGELIVEPLGDGRHTPTVALILVLTWIVWRRLPLAWTLYAGAAALVMLSAANLDSLERYVVGTVPFVVAAAQIVSARWWRVVIALSSVALVGLTALAWDGRYVP
jgi:hypothetical protein